MFMRTHEYAGQNYRFFQHMQVSKGYNNKTVKTQFAVEILKENFKLTLCHFEITT